MRALPALLVLASLLLAGCAGPSERGGSGDTDGDGLPDAQERAPREIAVMDAGGNVTRREVTSDPAERDTDGDGLEDLDESIRGTDPRSVDTDADGLLDGNDVALDAGSERAGELRALGIVEMPAGTFLGELDQCPDRGGLKSAEASSDRPFADALPDGFELVPRSVVVRGETREVTSDPCVGDTDGDGLPDDVEHRVGTDPRERDTDGDGLADGVDADPSWDLGLALTDVHVERHGRVNLTMHVGAASDSMVGPDAQPPAVDVEERGFSRERFVVVAYLVATDPETGEGVPLFPGGAGASITFDLLQGTAEVDGVPQEGTLFFEGAEGKLAFGWRTTRS